MTPHDLESSAATFANRRNVLLPCTSVLVSVALFEGAVRAACIDSNQSPNWRYHPVLGWSQVSTGSYDIVVDGRPVPVSFNSIGFRERV